MNNRPRKTALAAAIATAIASAPAGAQVSNEQETEVEEIVVTGSRIKRSDLSAPSPVAVVTSAQIVQTGTVNIDSLLNEMPQVMPGWTNSSNFPGTGTATVDLRGLGARRTLVLVNGKRFIPTNPDGTVDLSGIPTALVDRIEVMTGGASAVYGSDAIAGVVNFILDDSYEGFEFGGNYDVTTKYSDGEVYNLHAKFGISSDDDASNITVFAGYTDRSAITQDARPYTTFALDDGSVDGVATLVPGGSSNTPGSRFSVDRSAIPADIGNNLGGNINSITFDNGAPLAWNDPEDRYNYAPPSYLQVPQERFQTQLFATHEINRNVNISFEAMFMHQEADTQFAPQPEAIRSSEAVDFHFAENPFLTDASKDILAASELITDAARGLPTGDGIGRISFLGHRVSSVGPRRDERRFDVWRSMFAVDGEITENWDYEVYYSLGQSSNAHRIDNRVNSDRWNQAINATTDPGTGLAVCIDPSDGCAPVNPFGVDLISPEAVAFIKTAQNFYDTYEQETAGLTFVGDLPGGLEAGPIGAAFGVEWRDESYQSLPDSNAMIGDANRLPTQGSYDVAEAFVEFNVPLLANVTSTDYLGINAAYRYSDYSTIGGVDTWRYGFEWSPSFVEGLRFRGGQQRSIRAPNIIELFAPEMGAGLTIYQDPCDAESGLLNSPEQQQFCNDWGAPTGFVQLNGTVSALQNSNPDLKPEEADTWTVGFVYQPAALAEHNFAITVDYYDIEIADAVAPFGGGVDNHITSCFFSLDLNDEFCTTLERDFTGEFEPINSQLTNVSLKKVSGVDLQVDYAFDLGSGDFEIFFLGTYQIDNGFQATALLPYLECAGKFGVPCGGEIDGTGSPRTRTNTRFAWSTGPWRVGLNWRWLEGMEDARTVRAIAFGLDPQPIIDTIPAEAITTSDYNYVDIFGTWQFNDNTTFRLGFDNVFEKEPPLMGDAQIQANTEPGTYDVFGRRVWLNFNMSF